MHSVRNVDIQGIAHRHILFLRHSVGDDGGVMHGVRHIHIHSVVHGVRHVDVDRVAHIHLFDRHGGRGRRRGRPLFAFGELSTEGQPHGVAGLQGVDVHMGDGVEALHPVGSRYGVDRLSFLDDVHIELAAVHHLLLLAHPDGHGARFLRPGRKARQQQRQYQQYPFHIFYSHSMVAGGLELMSYTTRLTPRTRLIISLLTRAMKSYGRWLQSAVMPSTLSTARSATTLS